MKTDVERIANYEARMQSTLIDPVVTAMNALAVANYTAYITEFYPYQVQLRTILLDEGVKTYLFAIYEAANGQYYHLYKVSLGNPQVADFTAIQVAWTARGGDATILKRVALDVYGVTIP